MAKITSQNLQDELIEDSTPELQVERITGQVMEVSKTRKIQNFEKIENQEAEVNGARTKGTDHMWEKNHHQKKKMN